VDGRAWGCVKRGCEGTVGFPAYVVVVERSFVVERAFVAVRRAGVVRSKGRDALDLVDQR
jgi:hypothetical protein